MTQSTSPTMDRLSLLLTNHLSQLPHALVPEVFQSSPPSATTGHKRRSDTAWLDGLRGVAALMVVLQHEQAMVYMGHAFCYHWPEQTSPASWPILRLAFSGGSFAVVVFFVISGESISLSRHAVSNSEESSSVFFYLFLARNEDLKGGKPFCSNSRGN